MVYSVNELLLWVTRENFAEERVVVGCDFFPLPFSSLNRKGVKNSELFGRGKCKNASSKGKTKTPTLAPPSSFEEWRCLADWFGQPWTPIRTVMTTSSLVSHSWLPKDFAPHLPTAPRPRSLTG